MAGASLVAALLMHHRAAALRTDDVNKTHALICTTGIIIDPLPGAVGRNGACYVHGESAAWAANLALSKHFRAFALAERTSVWSGAGGKFESRALVQNGEN